MFGRYFVLFDDDSNITGGPTNNDVIEDNDVDTRDVIDVMGSEIDSITENDSEIMNAINKLSDRLDSFEKQLKTTQAVFIENGGVVKEVKEDNNIGADVFRDISDVRNLNLF